MNRATGLGIVGLLLLMAGVGYFRPDFFPGLDAPKFAWLLMALLLVSGAGWGFWRFRHDGGRALAGILFWAAALVIVAWTYQVLH